MNFFLFHQVNAALNIKTKKESYSYTLFSETPFTVDYYFFHTETWKCTAKFKDTFTFLLV